MVMFFDAAVLTVIAHDPWNRAPVSGGTVFKVNTLGIPTTYTRYSPPDKAACKFTGYPNGQTYLVPIYGIMLTIQW